MRLDKYVAGLKGVETRSHAKILVQRGDVSVNGEIVTKPSYTLHKEDKVEVYVSEPLFVGRGAVKLDKFLKAHPEVLEHVDVACDFGASTGGFTQVLLQKGISKVYAIDVGRGQLHHTLIEDPRVISMEETDIRDLTTSSFEEEIHFGVCDLSFISLQEILPSMLKVLKAPFKLVVLFKPQFQVKHTEKEEHFKGVVVSREQRKALLLELEKWIKKQKLPIHIETVMQSVIQGKKGNKEYFLVLSS